MSIRSRAFSQLFVALCCSFALIRGGVVPKSIRVDVGRGIISGGVILAGGLISGILPNPIVLAQSPYPIKGDEDIMKRKAHGTSMQPVQDKLRWGCDVKLADNICNFNRRWAENSGYFLSTAFLKEVDRTKETTYYDSVTGKPLFIAPRGRTFEEFEAESRSHGWPSFRDDEVVWENVRCLGDGETVSLTGTHLGHNLPDGKGNRYCINLVSIAGYPAEGSA
jgi:peptide methionine sulfoxide reductase MsrB